jgi:hypothetical protein
MGVLLLEEGTSSSSGAHPPGIDRGDQHYLRNKRQKELCVWMYSFIAVDIKALVLLYIHNVEF